MGGLHHSVLGSSRLTNPADNPPKDREILSRGWGPSQGRLRYRTVRGQSVPDYTPPPGIGSLEKVRGIARRKGVVWVPNTFFSQMLTLAIATKPLYLQIGERRAERTRWITRLALMTEEPETDGEE